MKKTQNLYKNIEWKTVTEILSKLVFLHLTRFSFMCWIRGDLTIHPTIKGTLPPTDIKPTPFRHFAYKVAELQEDATTPRLVALCLFTL